uniref:ZP domain-containing protein n=1 Tax=Cyclopterus lumpus TaxID=8103 RepID=A0A8C2W9L7_CYCLU
MLVFIFPPDGTQHIVLTPNLAAQCGYSMESDPWGNTRIYSSLLGCYVDNQVCLNVVTHDVKQTCSYTRWASREILCDRNYMEVAKGQTQDASGAEHGIWKLTFYTPEPVSMVLREAEQVGYAAMATSTRLVMRSPYNTAETTSEEVDGVSMEVFRVSAYYKAPHGLVGLSLTGGVLFINNVISWHVPRRMTPLVDGSFEIREMHMGINGRRLDRSQMAARGYTLSATDFHIIIEIPVGSPDGHYKVGKSSNYQYHITYIVEPMLEVLWRTTVAHDDTRYKVLFPITTPLILQALHIQENTIPDAREFNVVLGPLLPDVVLRNITFFTTVLTVEESNARGFTVQEHHYTNGTKSISVLVSFDADIVLKDASEIIDAKCYLVPAYLLCIKCFSNITASLQDVELPTITGSCDQNQFYISVKYGSQGNNFKAMVGHQQLTPEMADYQFQENSTHFSLVLPYTAKDTTFEVYSLRARVDFFLLHTSNDWVLADLFLSCNFPLTTTKCYPNGTMTATAVKVDSVTDIIPSRLTLKDQSCKPAFSGDRIAYFLFNVASCGTTRTFFDHYMLYENEIALPYNKGASPVGPQYRQTISCYYVVNETQTVGFGANPRLYEPTAEIGSGQLMVQMRLAQDSSYTLFYQAEDYPVVKYLRQSLYFEVELVESTDPNLELILESCWATLDEDRTSLPSWDIIVDSCENPDDSYVTIFHPVVSDARVLVPSHIKRFSMKMFTFTKDKEVLKDEVKYELCVLVTSHMQRGTDTINQRQISSGPIVLTSGQTSE